MVGVYDSLIGQTETANAPRKWTREEKLALAGLLVSAVSIAISFYLTRRETTTANPCSVCDGENHDQRLRIARRA
jgi:hypothetical protein